MPDGAGLAVARPMLPRTTPSHASFRRSSGDSHARCALARTAVCAALAGACALSIASPAIADPPARPTEVLPPAPATTAAAPTSAPAEPEAAEPEPAETKPARSRVSSYSDETTSPEVGVEGLPEYRAARGRRTAGIVMISVGGAGVIIGGIWMIAASLRECGWLGGCQPDHASQAGAGVLMALGGASVVVGGILIGTARSKLRELENPYDVASGVQLHVGLGAGSLTLGGTF